MPFFHEHFPFVWICGGAPHRYNTEAMDRSSSRKNPGYSRRRESIEDHVAQARRCGDRLGIAWTRKLGSRPFVEDLIKRHVVDGPCPAGAKAVGPGIAQRFRPRDLRALLEVLRLKSRGATHRKTWILQLWLRGRDYELDVVREALRSEIQRVVTNIRAIFSKTDRFTGPFERRFRGAHGRATSSKYDEALKIMSALIVQPTELQSLDIDVDAIAKLLTEDSDASTDELAALLRESIEAAKAGVQLNDETNLRWSEIARQLPGGKELLELMSLDPSRATDMVNHAHGAIDDGFGVSNLVRTAQECTDEQLLRARRWHQAIRFNMMGPPPSEADLASLAPEHRRVAEWLYANDMMMRQFIRQGPDVSTLIFGIILNDEMPAKTPDWNRKRVDVSALLKHIRDKTPRQELRRSKRSNTLRYKSARVLQRCCRTLKGHASSCNRAARPPRMAKTPERSSGFMVG